MPPKRRPTAKESKPTIGPGKNESMTAEGLKIPHSLHVDVIGQHAIVTEVFVTEIGTISVRSGSFSMHLCPETCAKLGVAMVNAAAHAEKILRQRKDAADANTP